MSSTAAAPPIRLLVVVEGQTEEEFVKRLLVPHLADHNVVANATIVGKQLAIRRGHRTRGGGHFGSWRADIARILDKGTDQGLRVTTLFDLYGLPDDFPGLDRLSSDRDTNRRCDALEEELTKAAKDRRFIPYIQRHEFEALVLASLPGLEMVLDADDDLQGLRTLRQELADAAPEDVNDGPETAPSKRLIRCIPGYRKTLHGPLATGDTGIAALRAACPRFDAWVGKMEVLGAIS